MKKLIVMLASLALVASFALTASAGDWNFYGSARVSTTWTDSETIGTAGSDVDSFALGLQGNSRVGAKVKVSDELSGRFEYGTGVNVRLLYGEWNFGAGSFLVGQTYTPLNMFYSNQIYGGDTDLLAYGGVYSGRQPMLRLKFGDFQIALTNVVEDDAYVSAADPTVDATNDVDMPAIEAAYSLKFDPVAVKFAGGYQTYEADDGVNCYDVDSYVLAVGAAANFGMFYLKGNVWFGQNPDTLLWIDPGGSTDPTANGAQENDVDGLGYLLVVGGKLNDMFSVEFGYGYMETELDTDTSANEVASYYGQATITFAPGVFVVPEIGVVDHEESGESDTTYFAAKWQINF